MLARTLNRLVGTLMLFEIGVYYHLMFLGKLNKDSIELQTVAGAYWRGDEKNAMLQVLSCLLVCYNIIKTLNTESIWYSVGDT